MISLIFKNIFKKIRYQKFFSFLFIINLTLALFSFLWVNILKDAVNDYVETYNKNILGGDLYIKRYKPLDEKMVLEVEKSFGTKEFTRSENVSLYAMVTSKNPSSKNLSKISFARFIDDVYPLYGDFSLEDASGNIKSLNENPEIKKQLKATATAWLDEKLSLFLNVSIGDTVRLGDLDVVVTHIIKKDLRVIIGREATLPRIYIHRDFFEATHLYAPGTRVMFFNVYAFHKAVDLLALKTTLEKLLDGEYKKEQVFTQTSKEYAQSILIVLSYVVDYLSLIALTNLFLSGISAFYLFNSHIQSSLKEYAILLTLSPKRLIAFFMIFGELLVLCLLSFLFTLALYGFTHNLIVHYFSDILPHNISLDLEPIQLFFIFFVAVMNALMFCGLPLYKVFSVRIIDLFKNDFRLVLPKKVTLLFTLFPIVVYYLLYVEIAKSQKTATIFFLLLFATCLITYGIGLGMLWALKRISHRLPFPMSLIALNISRNKNYVLNIFITLCLITAVTTYIPQAQKSISSQIQNPDTSIPSLFLFDIKKQDVSVLETTLAKNQTQLNGLTPMVMGQLMEIDGVSLDDWKVGDEFKERVENMFKNKASNFTYHNTLNSSESIIEGEPLTKTTYNDGDEAELSITKEMKEMLGIGIGSRLLFNVEGVDVIGRVKNIREVQWNSFTPNFFMVFQEGVFETFPQTYLAYIPQLKNVEQRINIQKDVISVLGSISILDVQEVLEESMENIRIIYFLSTVMASFSVLCGLIVFLSSMTEQVLKRRGEINLVKILSPSHSLVMKVFMGEFFVVGFLSSLLGIFLSLGINILSFKFLFEDKWIFSFPILLISLFVSMCVILLVTFFTTRKTLNEKTVVFLKESL